MSKGRKRADQAISEMVTQRLKDVVSPSVPVPDPDRDIVLVRINTGGAVDHWSIQAMLDDYVEVLELSGLAGDHIVDVVKRLRPDAEIVERNWRSSNRWKPAEFVTIHRVLERAVRVKSQKRAGLE